ncbi:uncharacterized protein LOC106012283 [Aplysia californica]|uniref:Uncharacterized protein LOC106012283 n=1 Tax=Aplysia californica TaxID=6500 RepID=A0ABM1VW29_APLCA|nr:uncharacterized protein LOC106012283 [Aplysia californica]
MPTIPDEKDMKELKSFAAPPQAVKDVFSGLFALLGFKRGDAEDWKFAKRQMGSVGDQSINSQMARFDPKPLTPAKVKYVQEKLAPHSPEHVRNVSRALEGYYLWVRDTVNSLPSELKDEQPTEQAAKQ